MRRTASTVGKVSWGRRAAAAFVLYAAAVASSAQTLTTLHSFCAQSGCADGGNPYAGLVQGTDGNFYGTTFGGAAGFGVVFKIAPNGRLKTLYSFTGGTDGGYPYAGLTLAANGNFYGTAYGNGCCGGGTLFTVSRGGALTTLHGFGSQTGDGCFPYAGVVQATNGNLYGTTWGCGPNGGGTVFKSTLSGAETVLYSFCAQSGCTDGQVPNAGLIQATDGNFYGTTVQGGAGHGTVFKITAVGKLTTLYTFCTQSGCKDGQYPYSAQLVQGTDGNFYGTTENGGTGMYGPGAGCGTVFKITPARKLTTLYSFCSQAGWTDGAYPVAGLIQATDGNLYGTTLDGGANCVGNSGCGTVFKITPSGEFTTVYSFCAQSGCADGEYPWAGLVQGTDGNFYGTTENGALGGGTVFRLNTGLGPFVRTVPNSSKVGAPVKILGTNLTGATSVTFNGTAAVLTVASSSLITTTVPTGATTGPVEVITPLGTLSSNVPFRVP